MTYLAAGLSKKEALDSLLAVLNDQEVELTLAQNPHLNSTQLATLYAKASVEVAVLIASRQDLSDELIWKIIKGKRVITRQALISQNHFSGNPLLKLSDTHLEWLLAQDWFTADYAGALACWYPKSSPLIKQVADREYSSRPTSGMHSFKRIASQIRGIRGTKRVTTYQAYKRNYSDLNYHSQGELRKALEQPIADLLKVLQGKKATECVRLPTAIGPEKLASVLQRSFGKPDPARYQLFFSLLPTWEGSINELIGTVRSLVATPTQKAKKAS